LNSQTLLVEYSIDVVRKQKLRQFAVAVLNASVVILLHVEVFVVDFSAFMST
jgi:hypothetical protein